MSVILETTIGDITMDLHCKERPNCSLNFLKLCKTKYYNLQLFHKVQRNFIAQTGDPTGTGRGGESVFCRLYGEQAKYFEGEKKPRLRHEKVGTLSMVNNGNNMNGSQFFLTLGENLTYLDEEHTVFGEVVEGFDVLQKLNETICDNGGRPYQDIRITHTVILHDPFEDPAGLEIPDASPVPTKEMLETDYIAADEEIDDTKGRDVKEIEEKIKDSEAKARATILEMVGDIPDADVRPPENMLFVCKLNPVTSSEDLETIFQRFGMIVSCEVIKDNKTGESLQYAFIEFEREEDCENAYFKMDNVLIDDRRIHVDFSQSVSKLSWEAGASRDKKSHSRQNLVIKGGRKTDGYDMIFDTGSSRDKHKIKSFGHEAKPISRSRDYENKKKGQTSHFSNKEYKKTTYNDRDKYAHDEACPSERERIFSKTHSKGSVKRTHSEGSVKRSELPRRDTPFPKSKSNQTQRHNRCSSPSLSPVRKEFIKKKRRHDSSSSEGSPMPSSSKQITSDYHSKRKKTEHFARSRSVSPNAFHQHYVKSHSRSEKSKRKRKESSEDMDKYKSSRYFSHSRSRSLEKLHQNKIISKSYGKTSRSPQPSYTNKQSKTFKDPKSSKDYEMKSISKSKAKRTKQNSSSSDDFDTENIHQKKSKSTERKNNSSSSDDSSLSEDRYDKVKKSHKSRSIRKYGSSEGVSEENYLPETVNSRKTNSCKSKHDYSSEKVNHKKFNSIKLKKGSSTSSSSSSNDDYCEKKNRSRKKLYQKNKCGSSEYISEKSIPQKTVNPEKINYYKHEKDYRSKKFHHKKSTVIKHKKDTSSSEDSSSNEDYQEKIEKSHKSKSTRRNKHGSS